MLNVPASPRRRNSNRPLPPTHRSLNRAFRHMLGRYSVPLLDNARAAAKLDWQIAFTDGPDPWAPLRIGVIDRIVYRLYGLTDEEVAVVEGA